MLPALTYRKYEAQDLERLRAMFFSNIPPYFDESEWPLFEKFLANDLGTNWIYEVALHEGRIVGAGGIGLKPDGTVNMAWGMLDRNEHKKGFGRLLLEHRLEWAERAFPGLPVSVTTSQYTYGFFERLGFIVTEFKEDFWAKDLHLYRMIRYTDPSTALRFRPYEVNDLGAVRRVFFSNCPPYFETQEWKDLEGFLQKDLNETCSYEVALLGGIVVGAGGIGLNDDNTVSLCWGMLEARLHKKGFGRVLLQRRLEQATKTFPGLPVVLSTTQHTASFFEKHGFVTTDFKENFWSEGLHLHKMIKQDTWKK